jgi:hypothetical protein
VAGRGLPTLSPTKGRSLDLRCRRSLAYSSGISVIMVGVVRPLRPTQELASTSGGMASAGAADGRRP